MRERAAYSRIYWSVMDDEKFDGIREDPRAIGAWVLLLVIADMAYPTAAYIPAPVTRALFARLVACGLVEELPHRRYRIHGLEAERERRSQSAAQSATLRWSRDKVEGGKPASRRTRFKVLERDNYRCRYCGRSSDAVVLDVDHVKPIREGGTDDLENLVAACVDCNAGKSGYPVRAHPPENARASDEPSARSARRDEDETRQAEADARAPDDDGRTDLETFLLLKRRAPTPRQRQFLDGLLERHDQTGPAWAADIMMRHPDDPIGALITADKDYRAERIAEAQAAERPKPRPRRRASVPESTRELLEHWAAQAKEKASA